MSFLCLMMDGYFVRSCLIGTRMKLLTSCSGVAMASEMMEGSLRGIFITSLADVAGALCRGIWQNWEQRWAKGTIDRSSDTDSIFQFYRTIQSVHVKFRFLYRPIVSVRFEFRFFNRPILFLGIKFRLLYCAIVKNRFTDTLFVDNLISFSL